MAQLPEHNLSLVKQVVTNGESGSNAYALGSTFVFSGHAYSQQATDWLASYAFLHTLRCALAAAQSNGQGIFGKRWDAAVAADGLLPSRYGQTKNVEDVAQSARLYQKVVGINDEA